MARSRLTSNPVYTRLTQASRGPSLRVTIWLALAWSLFVLAATILVGRWLYARGGYDPVMAWGRQIFWPAMAAHGVLLLILPVAAISLTVRDTVGEEFVMLRLTTQPGWKVAFGYLGAALFRLRILLALLTALIPLAVMGNVYENFGEPLQDLLASAAIWGMTVLGGAVGVWMGLVWRRLLLAILSTAVIMALVILPYTRAFYVVGIPLPTIRLAVALIVWALTPVVLWLAGLAYERIPLR